MKTLHSRTVKTPIGDIDRWYVKAAGSTQGEELEVCFGGTQCGDIINGISIGNVVFRREDIIAIANKVKATKKHNIF